MSILLTDEQIKEVKVGYVAILVDGKPQIRDSDRVLIKAQLKKVTLELQAIYNLPDEGMFHKKMGKFIEELNEEVISDNIC